MSKNRKPVLYRAEEIAIRDGAWSCHYCGIGLIPLGTSSDDDRYYTKLAPRIYQLNDGLAECQVDHVIPVSRGGMDALENLVLTCPRCNQRKGGKTDVEFVEWLMARGEYCEQ